MLLGAFGDPGHAFPIIALGEELARRGHAVTVETWERWRAPVEAAGMAFAPAPEYHVFPTLDRPLKPYEAVVVAARHTRSLVARVAPDAVVSDILTLAPALAAELEGVPVATVIPHVDPRMAPGLPAYSIGARASRTTLGRRLWSAGDPILRRGLEMGRVELNQTRGDLGLPPLSHVHGGISRSLCIVGTFPALEYPRDWPATTHVVGPLLWEPPTDPTPAPPGVGPLVVVAPSTSQDPDHALLRAALEGLAGEPVRVLATWNRRPPSTALPEPGNARVVDWLAYSSAMADADVVVCHGGHGTVARALASGCAVVAVPAAGDMNENAARVEWAGVGVRVPRRLVSPRSIRLAVRRALRRPGVRERAAELRAWSEQRSGAARAADLVEPWAARVSRTR